MFVHPTKELGLNTDDLESSKIIVRYPLIRPPFLINLHGTPSLHAVNIEGKGRSIHHEQDRQGPSNRRLHSPPSGRQSGSGQNISYKQKKPL